MSLLSEAFGIPAELKKVHAAFEQEEAEIGAVMSAGAQAALTIEGIAASPGNIANDLSALPSLIAEVKAGFAAANTAVTVFKAAIATKAAAKPTSISVVTKAPLVVAHPATGAPIAVPTGSTVTVPALPGAEVDPATGTNFPAQSGNVAQGSSVNDLNADGGTPINGVNPDGSAVIISDAPPLEI